MKYLLLASLILGGCSAGANSPLPGTSAMLTSADTPGGMITKDDSVGGGPPPIKAHALLPSMLRADASRKIENIFQGVDPWANSAHFTWYAKVNKVNPAYAMGLDPVLPK